MKEASKFKFLRQMKDKAKSPNALKLLKQIEELMEKGNQLRAEALLARYKRKYANGNEEFRIVCAYLKKN